MFTSGGDSQGMNAAVRGVARAALSCGIPVYAVWDGYKGLVEGTMTPLGWTDLSNMIAAGGTKIGTARCAEFRTPEGRQAAVVNLVRSGVGAMVVIGGDGSLTGASILASEWEDHVGAAVAAGVLPEGTVSDPLHVVGLVGSIDNDMFGTHFTIGCVSALHRIVEAIDAIRATAASHSRTFVVEVMGRRCGWLALMAGLATQADFVFIPESPPCAHDHACGDTHDPEPWVAPLVSKLGKMRGKRWSVVIVAEGAADCAHNPITADRIKAVLEDQLGHDTRITKLGHVQRGGKPAAFDRYMSTNLGVAALESIARAYAANSAPEPTYFGCTSALTYPVDLMPAVASTHKVRDFINAGQYGLAMDARGAEYPRVFRMLRTLLRSDPHDSDLGLPHFHVAVLHVGAPAPGMNAAVATLTRILLDAGVSSITGIRNGFEGFASDSKVPLTWDTVQDWVSEGGSRLGTTRTLPNQLAPEGTPEAEALDWLGPIVAEYDALVLIGGFEAARSLCLLAEAGPRLWPSTSAILIPATISNNVPCTQYSVGTDTALNSIVEACDRVKQSAYSSSHRVFVVEVMGARCGFLASMAAVAAGAEKVYTHESGVSASDILADVEEFKARFAESTASDTPRSALVLISNGASEQYSTQLFCSIYEAESDGVFSVRSSILGYLQQGGSPTPLDRIRGTMLAAHAANRLLSIRTEGSAPQFLSAGIQDSDAILVDVDTLAASMDMKNRRPTCQWWEELCTRNLSITSSESDDFDFVGAPQVSGMCNIAPLSTSEGTSASEGTSTSEGTSASEGTSTSEGTSA